MTKKNPIVAITRRRILSPQLKIYSNIFFYFETLTFVQIIYLGYGASFMVIF